MPRVGILLLVAFACSVPCAIAADAKIRFEREPQRVVVRAGDQPIATYVFQDEQISRPYFCHLFTTGGKRVTRNHPPIEGTDLTDHDTFHPGLWLAFGDLGGSDFWRLKSPVEHAGFVEEPRATEHGGTFTVMNHYRSEPGGRVICDETCKYTWILQDAGYLLEIESVFQNDDAGFFFGDQEEMGLGVRMATPLIVRKSGTILNSAGQRDEAQSWGKAADWCDYSGIDGKHRVGVLMMPSPKNFRQSWFHVRDYGLMAANPFGRHAMTGGEPSRVEVAARESFRLAYGVFVYECDADDSPPREAIFKRYSQTEQQR